MSPAQLRLHIDLSDAYGDVLRAQLAIADGRSKDPGTRQRVLAERIERWEKAKKAIEEKGMTSP